MGSEWKMAEILAEDKLTQVFHGYMPTLQGVKVLSAKKSKIWANQCLKDQEEV